MPDKKIAPVDIYTPHSEGHSLTVGELHPSVRQAYFAEMAADIHDRLRKLMDKDRPQNVQPVLVLHSERD